MSVRVMSWVWDHGPEDQAELLVLLALADFCNDAGECWPSMSAIARKARVWERSARRIVRRLEAQGFLEIRVGGGRCTSSRYRILMRENPDRQSGIDNPGSGNPDPGSQKPGPTGPETRTRRSPEPSGTVSEPQSASYEAHVIRHASEPSEAIALYNRAAAEAGWPQVQRMSPTRTRALKARLAECGGIEGWEVALRRALDSDFLCGRTTRPWAGFCFDWLVKPGNFAKVMEGNYDNRDRAAGGLDDATLRAIARAAARGQA